MVFIPGEMFPETTAYFYAVTNWHVAVRDGFSTIRVNAKEGTVDSSGRGNSRCEFSRGCYEAKSFSWTRVKLERDSVQTLLAISR